MNYRDLLQEKKREWVKSLSDKYGFSNKEALDHITNIEDIKLITSNTEKVREDVSFDSKIKRRKYVVGIPESDGVSKEFVHGERVTRIDKSEEPLILLQM